MIGTQAKRIIVDTGSMADCGKLLESMKSLGMQPQNIDVVVNTHLHSDHCGCNEIFESAKIIAHELEEPPVGNLRISGGLTLDQNITIVPTPGHTRGSISVFVQSDRRTAISGDALPTKANFDTLSPPFIAYDKKLALVSMKAIIEWADVVIPGHDAQFETLRK